MSFVEDLQALSLKTEKLCNTLQTEEATKNALILPLIHMLGYDIFDPTEVTPEFVADVGIKKGEKIDWCQVCDSAMFSKYRFSTLSLAHASLLSMASVMRVTSASHVEGVEAPDYAECLNEHSTPR
jgi:hypothetical protein